jgi:cytochrome c
MRALLVLLLVLVPIPAAAADGQRLYDDECAGCHSLEPASTAAGPSLKAVIWRKVAALPDFSYSEGLKGLGGLWSPARLDEYLKNTQALAPGTDMFFTIADPDDRKAIIAYLKTIK